MSSTCPSLLRFPCQISPAMENENGLLGHSDDDEKTAAPGQSKAISRGGTVGTKKSRHSNEGDTAASSEQKRITSVLKENKSLISLIIKQVLANTQSERDTMQILYDVYLANAEQAPVAVAAGQNTLYNTKLQKKGKGHNLGPPFIWTSLGLLVGIKKIAPPNAQEAVQMIIDDYKKASLEEKCDILRFCRIVKTFDPNRKKVVLSWGPSPKAQEYRSTVMGILCSLENWEYKVGRPPPGHMERELGVWLKELLK